MNQTFTGNYEILSKANLGLHQTHHPCLTGSASVCLLGKHQNHTAAERKMIGEGSPVILNANWREMRNDEQFGLPV